jgi:predicted O-methyltransferase YrrM
MEKNTQLPITEKIQILKEEKKELTLEQERKIREKKYSFSTNWFEPHIPNWQNHLSFLKDKEINVLEIGVFEGRSTTWIIDELLTNTNSRLWAIDLFEKFWWREDEKEYYNHEKIFRENITKTGKEKQIEIMKGVSQKSLDKLNYEGKIKFDFIYIDGDHTAKGTISDAIRAFSLLKEGGIMIFDDYEWDCYKEDYNNPRMAVDAFLKCYEPQIEIIFKYYQVAIRKVNNEEKLKSTLREDKILT